MILAWITGFKFWTWTPIYVNHLNIFGLLVLILFSRRERHSISEQWKSFANTLLNKGCKIEKKKNFHFFLGGGDKNKKKMLAFMQISKQGSREENNLCKKDLMPASLPPTSLSAQNTLSVNATVTSLVIQFCNKEFILLDKVSGAQEYQPLAFHCWSFPPWTMFSSIKDASAQQESFFVYGCFSARQVCVNQEINAGGFFATKKGKSNFLPLSWAYGTLRYPKSIQLSVKATDMQLLLGDHFDPK